MWKINNCSREASPKRRISFVDEMKKTHDGGRNKLNYRGTEIMACIVGTCSASSFSSCLLFHLTAKIKAFNQILLIGRDHGYRPRVSPLTLFLPLCISLPRSPAQRKEWQWVLDGWSACQSRLWAPTVNSTCWLTTSCYLCCLLQPWSRHILPAAPPSAPPSYRLPRQNDGILFNPSFFLLSFWCLFSIPHLFFSLFLALCVSI